jgi:hypothetical protein
MRHRPASDSEVIDAMTILVAILGEMGRIDDAAATARAALPVMRRKPKFRFEGYAQLLWRLGRLEAAARVLGALAALHRERREQHQINDDRVAARDARRAREFAARAATRGRDGRRRGARPERHLFAGRRGARDAPRAAASSLTRPRRANPQARARQSGYAFRTFHALLQPTSRLKPVRRRRVAASPRTPGAVPKEIRMNRSLKTRIAAIALPMLAKFVVIEAILAYAYAVVAALRRGHARRLHVRRRRRASRRSTPAPCSRSPRSTPRRRCSPGSRDSASAQSAR